MAKNARQQLADVMTERLADELGSPHTRAGLHYYAWTLGPAVCEQLLSEALVLADAPGEEAMWTTDGKRRRTSAGIFFTLAKHRRIRIATPHLAIVEGQVN